LEQRRSQYVTGFTPIEARVRDENFHSADEQGQEAHGGDPVGDADDGRVPRDSCRCRDPNRIGHLRDSTNLRTGRAGCPAARRPSCSQSTPAAPRSQNRARQQAAPSGTSTPKAVGTTKASTPSNGSPAVNRWEPAKSCSHQVAFAFRRRNLTHRSTKNAKPQFQSQSMEAFAGSTPNVIPQSLLARN